MHDADEQQLRRAAARAEADPFFVAFALAAYRTLAGLDHSRLAAWLSCPAQNMARLALCRRPEGESAMFGDEVRRIASYVEGDAGRLAHLLRAVENAEEMRTASPGALMAAQDREADASEVGSPQSKEGPGSRKDSGSTSSPPEASP